MGKGQKKDKSSYAQKKAAFWQAVMTERLRDLRDGLVNTGMEAQTRNEDGLTSIMLAALNGKQRSLDCLLDYYERRRELRRRGWINIQDDNRRTALMMAAAAGRLDCVESLLIKEARVDLKDEDGKTARDLALERKKDDIVKFMDDWFHESEEEVIEDEDGNLVSDGLTSTQRNKLKKRQLEALERRGLKSKDKSKNKDESDDEPEDTEPGPTPVWPEVAKIKESVELLRPLHEIAIVRDEAQPSLPNGIDPALWYQRSINRLELRLAPGSLVSLPGADLVRLRRLHTLILNDNALTALPEEIGRLKQLRVLEVARNQLESLPESLVKCQQLDVVDVSFNKLTDLEQLKGLPAIGTINVSNNELTELDLDFDQLGRLHDLMCSNNKIEELPSEFGLLAGLTDFIAENNCITELPVELTDLKKVKVLKLAGNPISDPRLRRMLEGNDNIKDIWKYLQKSAGGKKGKGKGKGKGKKGKADAAAAAPPPAPDADEDDGFFSDDSFDITMDEL